MKRCKADNPGPGGPWLAMMLCVLSLMAGCGGASPQTPLAWVGRQPVTEHDWQIAVGANEILQRRTLPTTGQAKRAQVEELAQQRVVAGWARDHRLMTSKKAFSAAGSFIRTRIWPEFGGVSGFRRALARHGLNEREFSAYVARQMMIQAVFDRVTASVPAPSPQAVRTYYQEHPQAYTTPPTVLARVIVAASRAQAQGLETQLQKGASFQALAQKYSRDKTTARQGGSLGWVNLAGNSVSSARKRTLEKLLPGQYGIAPDPLGYSIIEVQARRPGTVVPFHTVKPAITAQLWHSAKAARFQAWADRQIARAHIRLVVSG